MSAMRTDLPLAALLLVFTQACLLCPDSYSFTVRVQTAPDLPARHVRVFVQCVRLSDGAALSGEDGTGSIGSAFITLPAEQRCAAVRRTFAAELSSCLFVLTDDNRRSFSVRLSGADLDAYEPEGDDDAQLHAVIPLTFTP